MAETVLKNIVVKFSTESSTGTSWTATTKIKNINLVYECDRTEKTQEGSSHRQYAPSIKNWSATIRFNNDFADNSVQEKMWQYFGTTGAYIIFQRSETATRWHGSFVLQTLPIIAGAVGSLAETEVTLMGCGQLVRDGDPLFFDLDQLFYDLDEIAF